MTTYRCPVCGRTFNTRWKLDKHLGKVHGGESEAKPRFEAKHTTSSLDYRRTREAIEEAVRKVLPDIIEEVLRETLPKMLEAKAFKEKVMEQELKVEGGVFTTKKVKVHPNVIMLYEYVQAHGGNTSFNEFVNEAILEHFTECLGIEPAIVRKRTK
ncbi:MAG: hypothetical protein B6U85_06965 [Desulfurococcales archaeon ex4484_42]|nr:MAG: hypothetical protein B6U85_06965 [Desulfurococcales archaeon ex4484_42]